MGTSLSSEGEIPPSREGKAAIAECACDRSTVVHADARQTGSILEKFGRLQFGEDYTEEPYLTATITSPPYGNLLDYGVDGQIGFSQSRNQYLRDCRRIFADTFRFTKDDGVLWLVVDSYIDGSPHDNGVSGLTPLPFTLANLAEEVGWTLREIVIWHKDRTRPWTHHGKFRNAFEHVLLLVKSGNFKFHAERLRDSQDLARWWVRYPERYNAFGKIPDNVWHIPIPTQGSWAGKAYQHACPLPPELVRRMVLLTTDVGDVVFDPFAGIGTVPAVAGGLKRRGYGIELNGSFVRSFEDHVRSEILAQATVATSPTGGPTPETIANLRLLKFPKAVFAKLRELRPDISVPVLIVCNVDEVPLVDAKASSVGRATWYYVFSKLTSERRTELEALLASVASIAPFTKYGVHGELRAISESTARRLLAGRSWYAYEHGRTWTTSQSVQGSAALRLGVSRMRGKFPPLVANVGVHVDLEYVGDAASTDPFRQ